MKRKFAIPTVDGKSCAHFGHCEGFAVVEVDGSDLGGIDFLNPPVHQPGSYPQFLAQQGVSVVIAGGMGQMAQNLFNQNNIEVLMGVGVEEPLTLVEKFLSDELQTGDNTCNHGSAEHEPNCGH